MKKLLILASLSIFSYFTWGADIGDEVESMFDGAYSNTTEPGVYKTQGASYVTFGGYSERNPITKKNINLVNINPPKVTAGCGGIDLQAGGFSMIDGDEFVDNLRNIGQNAKSLFFMLGLQLVTPTINDVMNKVNKFQKDYLQFNLDSCEAATQLVGGAMEYAGAEGGECIVRRMQQSGDDYAEAKKHCTTGMGRRNTMETGGENTVTFSKGNLIWWHLMQDDFFKNNLDYSLLVMNLLGTIIVKYDDNSADSGKEVIRISRAATEAGLTTDGRNIINALLSGTEGPAANLQLKTCTDMNNTKDACINYNGSNDVTIDWKGMTTYVQDTIADINTAISNNGSLSSDALAFLSQTPIPLYRFILLERANNPSAQFSTVTRDIADKLALSHLYSGLLATIEVVRDRVGDTDMTESKQVKAFMKDLDVVASAIINEQQTTEFRLQELSNIANHMHRVETQLKKRLSAETISSMNWSSKG
ncbi:hypothetical protein HF888_16385 (plasmid) [Bermanella marisrubri]|uniref:TraH n=1 Tax=Bermanella marisrubri TaxID=207949 RepID=Q1MY31_9GAMM|nr:conjugal transfer protein TraH [Bermanella marisrubri]EAT10865.1 TraH [Oceanobacter sp. RED65] [Bermanella marisrubri]QIZ85918.1 hypothetical protein HF888_16385 [Bermanella marisrubri]